MKILKKLFLALTFISLVSTTSGAMEPGAGGRPALNLNSVRAALKQIVESEYTGIVAGLLLPKWNIDLGLFSINSTTVIDYALKAAQTYSTQGISEVMPSLVYKKVAQVTIGACAKLALNKVPNWLANAQLNLLGSYTPAWLSKSLSVKNGAKVIAGIAVHGFMRDSSVANNPAPIN